MNRNVLSTDEVMSKLWLHLVNDFRSSLGMNYAQRPLSEYLKDGIKGLRSYKFPARSQVGTYLFKCEYQLENLFKRYRFKDDVFTDSDLRSLSIEKFIETQVRISSPLIIKPHTFLVLREARKIISSILGKYNLDEHLDQCRFGKRACVGTSYINSYLDCKLSKQLTGSKDHIAWFDRNVVQRDRILYRSLNTNLGPNPETWYRVCDTLTMSLVPKSYKALRSVMPDTLIGSYYTNGLGKLIQKRLRKVGLDITKLQVKHRQLAQTSSRSRKLATADLSAASDSITLELLRRLLPAKWFAAITYGRINNIIIDKQTMQMQSVITMGLGHTFPLQTLVFYALLQSIRKLVGSKQGRVSVYGDDLIYPAGLHRYVVSIFPDLHLNLNGDKTYVTDHFRESCGGDYYRGCDVRPFQPEGEFKLYDRQRFAAFLYKLLNGLMRRWDGVEIPSTLEYLESQLVLTQGIIFQVPPSFPDGSGVKVCRPIEKYFYSPVIAAPSVFGLQFKYLSHVADFRRVYFLDPYYWEYLRQKFNLSEETHPWDDDNDLHILQWRKISPKEGRRGRKTKVKRIPGVSSKSTGRILRQTGSVSHWV